MLDYKEITKSDISSIISKKVITIYLTIILKKNKKYFTPPLRINLHTHTHFIFTYTLKHG